MYSKKVVLDPKNNNNNNNVFNVSSYCKNELIKGVTHSHYVILISIISFHMFCHVLKNLFTVPLTLYLSSKMNKLEIC